MLVAVIMAGGSGQRFWPLSNEEHPKQLLKLFSDKTMIRETVERILPIIPRERIFIATNIKQAEDIARELPFLPEGNIIVEPKFKDTAACIGYATIYVRKKLGDVNFIVLPSDHLIEKKNDFLSIIERGEGLIDSHGRIAVFGIVPDRPETGYGYIECGSSDLGGYQQVISFKEKPGLETAMEYLERGNFHWNSGMFMWSGRTILSHIEEYMPGHWKTLSSMEDILGREDKVKELSDLFDEFEKISIDYGVMEKARDVVVIPADIGWNDIGNFTALDDVFDHMENGSVVRKNPGEKVVEYHSHDNIIINDSHKKVIATLGIEDTVIVETEDVLLVCKKDEAQDIKALLKEVEKNKG
jgi:mannose-1-phosphate guanylyltransferase